VLGALSRSLAHTAGHTGQITLLAKHYAGDAWKTLSIPRGSRRRSGPEVPRCHTGHAKSRSTGR